MTPNLHSFIDELTKVATQTAFGEDFYDEAEDLLAKGWQDKVHGGLSDKKTPKDFDPVALNKGLKVELEHTDDRHLAMEIAMDHLTEDKSYYDKLQKMEKEGGAIREGGALWRVWAKHPTLSGTTSILVTAPTRDAAADIIGRKLVTRVARHMGKRASLSVELAKIAGMEKQALLAKIMRLLETPIPGTPKLLMKVRGGAELAEREASRRGVLRKVINENIKKGLTKLRVDKLYQKLEPILGNTTLPAAERATFGARHVHSLAHRPFHAIIGNAPIPYASTIHNALTAGAQKLLGIPAAEAFSMPVAKGGAAKGEALEKIVENLRPKKRLEVGKKLRSLGGGAAIAGVPSAAIMSDQLTGRDR